MRKSTVACLFIGAVLLGVLSVAEARVSMRSKIGGFDFFRPSGLGGTGSVGLKWGSWKTAEDDPKETAYLMKLVKYAKKAQLAGKLDESRAWLNAAGNLRRLKNFKTAVAEAEADAIKEVQDEQVRNGGSGRDVEALGVEKTSLLQLVDEKLDATHSSHYHVGDRHGMETKHSMTTLYVAGEAAAEEGATSSGARQWAGSRKSAQKAL